MLEYEARGMQHASLAAFWLRLTVVRTSALESLLLRASCAGVAGPAAPVSNLKIPIGRPSQQRSPAMVSPYP